MSYQSQGLLEADFTFQQRNRACVMQQSETYKDDARPDVAATAAGCLRDDARLTGTFLRMAAAGPAIGDAVDNGDGTIDQSKVSDGDILALTQADFPVVAALYFDSTGVPI
jgi:hypothetical protein